MSGKRYNIDFLTAAANFFPQEKLLLGKTSQIKVTIANRN